MRTLRIGAECDDVALLQHLLTLWGYNLPSTGVFDKPTDEAVRLFQKSCRLTPDGIVGEMTWKSLQDDKQREVRRLRLNDSDFVRAAASLGVDVATVKAVQQVETGGRGGFLALNRPYILFEGHVFWRELTKAGKKPEQYMHGNEDILYEKWTKEHYKGGMGEYDRLTRALRIDERAAASATSWGLFQIMGFNYARCGSKNVREFVNRMMENEGAQLDLFVLYVKNTGGDRYLRNLDWAGFARYYNGPQYAQNKYDEKLAMAYMKYRE